MKKVITLRRNRDGTATFRYGSYVESFSVTDKGWYDVYENIRYAAITAGVTLDESTIESFLREAKQLVEN